MELISPAVTGYDQYRENIPRGVMETVEYPSTTVGNSRKAMVYTPPEFSSTTMYPVLFLFAWYWRRRNRMAYSWISANYSR